MEQAGDVQRDDIFEEYSRKAYDYLVPLIESGRQPTAAELLSRLEEELGWSVRWHFQRLVVWMREDRSVPRFLRDYARQTLTDEEVNAALIGDSRRVFEEHSAIDELLRQSAVYRSSRDFAELIQFVAKFREYSPFNNLLVKSQRPGATYFATAKDWRRRFGMSIKADARPMVILAPKHPVLFVYDLEDVDGPRPNHLEMFARVDGPFEGSRLRRALENCERWAIHVQFKPVERLLGGFVTTRLDGGDYKMRIVVNECYAPEERYAVLCHELAHIHLGHLGGDPDGWWPARLNLSRCSVEIEAEAAAYIVCKRAGLETESARYLAAFAREPGISDTVSVDMIVRVSGWIEKASTQSVPVPARGTRE